MKDTENNNNTNFVAPAAHSLTEGAQKKVLVMTQGMMSELAKRNGGEVVAPAPAVKKPSGLPTGWSQKREWQIGDNEIQYSKTSTTLSTQTTSCNKCVIMGLAAFVVAAIGIMIAQYSQSNGQSL